MQNIIKNCESYDVIISFNDRDSVVLKPNQFFYYESETSWFLIQPSDKDHNHLNVKVIQIDSTTPGSWKKEGF